MFQQIPIVMVAFIDPHDLSVWKIYIGCCCVDLNARAHLLMACHLEVVLDVCTTVRVWLVQEADITTHTGVVRPPQCALFVSSPDAVLASAVRSGSMRRRLISSVSCSVSSTCPVAGRHEIKDKHGVTAFTAGLLPLVIFNNE